MTEIKYRKPRLEDAKSIWNLVKNNKPLDENSLYLYTLLCHHFSDTCVIAESDSNVIGFLSGFILPKNPKTLFVWQAAVNLKHRNLGIAKNLVSQVLLQVGPQIEFIEATVTPSNKASLKFLQNFAKKLGTKLTLTTLFSTKTLGEDHEPENLVRIGPIQQKMEEIHA